MNFHTKNGNGKCGSRIVGISSVRKLDQAVSNGKKISAGAIQLTLLSNPSPAMYRKWLGISADRRPPTYYDLLGTTDGEHDSGVIRNAIEQRRAYLQSKRGEGQGGHVRATLGLFNEAASTSLVLEFKYGYDRHLGLHLKGKRRVNRRSYLLPIWMESLVVRIYGEGSGIVGNLFRIVAIIFGASKEMHATNPRSFRLFFRFFQVCTNRNLAQECLDRAEYVILSLLNVTVLNQRLGYLG